MLWIGVCEAVSVATLGGVFGGGLMALAHKFTNKWAMDKLEEYWKEDIYQLKGSCRLAHHRIEELEKKLSTLSVSKPVVNVGVRKQGKGYKNQRHFVQGV